VRTITDRPKTFEEITGHTLILDEFKRRSIDKNFPNYMLFVGDSGTGKSTSAFIISKLLNCENPIKHEGGHNEPCNMCKACLDVNEQRYRRDIHYLDATYIGKAEVGQLRNSAASRPMFDKNKIFIIDEAHLLNSKEARGAMLTLTEKHRPNTYFMLCTTDDSKFDSAFQSRFIKYLFRVVSGMDIASYLYEIVKKEEMEVPDIFIEKTLFLIAENVNGSLRSALQNLERCIVGKIFEPEAVSKEFGFVSSDQIYKMLIHLLTYDKKFFKVFDSFSDSAYVYNYINRTLISTLKHKVDNTYIKNPTFKKGSENIITKFPRELDKLRVAFTDLNLKLNGPYFNKNLFTFLMLNYYLDNIETGTHEIKDPKWVPVIEKKKRRAVASN